MVCLQSKAGLVRGFKQGAHPDVSQPGIWGRGGIELLPLHTDWKCKGEGRVHHCSNYTGIM